MVMWINVDMCVVGWLCWRHEELTTFFRFRSWNVTSKFQRKQLTASHSLLLQRREWQGFHFYWDSIINEWKWSKFCSDKCPMIRRRRRWCLGGNQTTMNWSLIWFCVVGIRDVFFCSVWSFEEEESWRTRIEGFDITKSHFWWRFCKVKIGTVTITFDPQFNVSPLSTHSIRILHCQNQYPSPNCIFFSSFNFILFYVFFVW